MARPTAPITGSPGYLSDAARALWAKSGDDRARETGDEPWLALPQHMQDTAEVAGQLWDSWVPRSVRETLSRGTGLAEQELRVLVTWLAAAHDLGKATVTFQTQLEARAGFEQFTDRLRRAGLPTSPTVQERLLERLPHGLASQVIACHWLRAQKVRPGTAQALAGVLDAHHGSPSRPAFRGPAQTAIAQDAEPWRQVREELLGYAAALSGIEAVLPRLGPRLVASDQTLLTGLVIMADWIASNAEAFPLTGSGTASAQADCRSQVGMAAVALTAPWLPAPPPQGADALDSHLRHRFTWPAEHRARPVQRVVAQACSDLDGPGLMVVEAPTGEGKTEAALTAAEILGAATGSGGVLVAAPTMATADGLFTRVLNWMRQAGDAQVTSMFLAHSKNRLNEDFEHLRFRGVGSVADDERGAELSTGGEVVASQWLSGRKKGVLATVCVATVDQVLFMALQARHSMLRHLGLAGKVVIIDEVHAYDAYMSEYLATALAWLARYRVPVVLLSATLPQGTKHELVQAYRQELQDGDLPALSTAYPLVTAVGTNGVSEYPVDLRETDLHARVEVMPDSTAALVDRLREETAAGGCVLVICNTVRRAQEAYLGLREAFPSAVELHHASFLASTRVTKESALRSALGPDAHRGFGRPDLRVVVATQVAEQSLDIDVDLLVTDLAPIDLVIQRIGRLHRHPRPREDRPEGLREPQVLLRAVLREDPPEFDVGATAVYEPAILLATLAVLREGPLHCGLRRPDDIAPLVHRVYGDDPPIPGTWEDAWQRAQQERAAAQDRARRRAATYRIPAPARSSTLDALFTVQTSDVDTLPGEAQGLAQVRDSDPTVEVIPIRLGENGGYRPLTEGAADVEWSPDAAPPRETARELAAATVRLPAFLTRFESRLDQVLDELERATPLGWQDSGLLRGQLALPLDTEGTCIVAGRTLRYDDELGLRDVTA